MSGRGRRRRLASGLSVAVAALVGSWFSGQVPAGATPVPAATAVSDYAACLSGTHQGDLLLLIDESSSLGGPNGTDPNAARVTAARYLIDTLRPRLIQANIHLSVSVAAFADRYRPVLGWTDLTSNRPKIDSAVDSLRTHNQGFETDYWSALDGARRSLADRAGTTKRCQGILFFTDGNLDYSIRKTAEDRRQFGTKKPFLKNHELTSEGSRKLAITAAKTDICRTGGLADAIRADGVKMFAVGLRGARAPGSDFDLLKEIATGRNGSQTCGAITQPAPGNFQEARDIDSLLFDLNGLIPGQTSTGNHPVCQAITRCAGDEHQFVLDASIQSVHILATSSVGGPQLVLARPGSPHIVLTNRGIGTVSRADAAGNIRYTWLSNKTLQIDLTEPSNGVGWSGLWSITFVDPTARSAGARSESSITVSGDVQPTWPAARSTTLRAGAHVDNLVLGLVDGRGRVVDPHRLLGTAKLSAQLLDANGNVLRDVARGLNQTTITRPLTLDLTNASPGPAVLRLRLAITTAAVKTGTHTTIPGTPLTPEGVDVPLTVRAPPNYPAPTTRVEVGSITGVVHRKVSIPFTGSGCAWLAAAGSGNSIQVLSAPAGVGRLTASSDASGPSTCQHLAGGRPGLPIVLSNEHQGSGQFQARIIVTTVPTVSGAKPVNTTVVLTGTYGTVLNKGEFALALAIGLLLGLGIPVLMILLLKWLEARIPPGTVAFERFPIEVRNGAVTRGGAPLAVQDSDFIHNRVAVAKGSRSMDILGLPLRTKIAPLPGVACYVVADAAGRVGASSDPVTPSTRRLQARLPLAVRNKWILLHDPKGPADAAEVILLSGSDATPTHRQQLVAEAARKVPRALTELRAAAQAAGLAAAPPPGGVPSSNTPWGAPSPVALAASPWSTGASQESPWSSNLAGGPPPGPAAPTPAPTPAGAPPSSPAPSAPPPPSPWNTSAPNPWTSGSAGPPKPWTSGPTDRPAP